MRQVAYRIHKCGSSSHRVLVWDHYIYWCTRFLISKGILIDKLVVLLLAWCSIALSVGSYGSLLLFTRTAIIIVRIFFHFGVCENFKCWNFSSAIFCQVFDFT